MRGIINLCKWHQLKHKVWNMDKICVLVPSKLQTFTQTIPLFLNLKFHHTFPILFFLEFCLRYIIDDLVFRLDDTKFIGLFIVIDFIFSYLRWLFDAKCFPQLILLVELHVHGVLLCIPIVHSLGTCPTLARFFLLYNLHIVKNI